MNAIYLTRKEIISKLDDWLTAWNDHHLERVMEWLHDDIVFENWDGKKIEGKDRLQLVWRMWFNDHGNFHFAMKDVLVDEQAQKFLFAWTLTWPSRESNYRGKRETRKGLDIIHLLDGRIISKLTYSKTYLKIDNKTVQLHACK